ncbi:MAG TPA: hypothetical protein VGF97_00185 [Rhizomicrobium sp.]|jgi:hypothetical protein
MSGDDFNQVFGARPQAGRSFATRVGGAEAPAATVEPKDEIAGSGAYKPYGFLPTGTINESCEVVHWVEGTEIPEGIEFPYRLVLQVAFVGDEQLKIFLPDCIVVIDGKHLRDLRKKLARRQCTFIQQYSARVWPNAKPQGEAIVEKIEVLRPNSE